MRSAARPRQEARPGTRLLVPALAVLVFLATAGCSPEEQPPAETGGSLAEPSDAPTLEIEPVTRLGEVTGPLARGRARQVEGRVSEIAVQWLTDAYVGGSYPRERFNGSFAGFSRGARAAARRDLRVMSNADIGARVDQVTSTRMAVDVDILAVDKHAVGSTAHVLTTFRTDSPRSRRSRVSGRLMLTKDHGRWNVFAYHVTKAGR